MPVNPLIINTDRIQSYTTVFNADPFFIMERPGLISITIMGGTLPYSYNWSNGATTEDIEVGKGITSLTIEVVDASGCSISKIFDLPIISLNPPLELSMPIWNVEHCNNSLGSMSVDVVGGNPPFQRILCNGYR